MEHSEGSTQGIAAIRAPRWWAAAAASFAVGCAIVLLGWIGFHADGNWLARPPSITVPAEGFGLLRGSARRDGRQVLLEATDAGRTAILPARIAPFSATTYTQVRFNLRLPGPAQPAVALLWQTQDQPTRTQVRPLVWVDDRVATLDMEGVEGWTGTITGIALAVRGTLLQPLVLESLVLPGVSAATAAADLRDDWLARSPFEVSSIAFPFDEERYQPLSLPAATALAVAVALVGYALVAWRRRWPFDARVAGAIVIAGWLLLDLRWQVNLWRQLAETADAFAGRSNDEKHLAAVDNELYSLMREVQAALPAAPARVVFLSDNVSLRARGGFFLYPHSVNSLYNARRSAPPAVSPDDLRPGDHVLLMLYHGASYDRDGKALVWADGRRRDVDELLYTSGGVALLRVK